MLKSFKSKINFSYFLLFFFVFITLIFSIKFFLRKSLEKNLENQMLQYIYIVESISKEFDEKNKYFKMLKNISNKIKIRITIIDFNGNVIFDSFIKDISSMDNHLLREEIQKSEREGFGLSERYSDTLKKNMFYIVRKAKDFYIRISMEVEEIKNILFGATKFIYIISAIFLLIIIILNYILAYNLSIPINEIVDFTKRFKQGEYDIRMPVYKLDELGLVKLSLNYLAKNISKNIDNLSMEKLRLEKIVKSVSEGLILLDEEGKVFLYNDGFFNIMEISKREIKDLFYFEAITNSRIIDMIDEALSQEKRKKDNFTTTKLKSFETKTISVTCIPLEMKKGAVILFEDITEEFNLAKFKREFISNASHEFKTPIAIMKGYIETLLDGVEDKNKQTDFLEKIHHNLIRLDNLINDVITLNKIEDYKDLFSFKKTNITKIIEDCVELLTPVAKKMHIKLINNFDNEIKINSSPELLEIIFFNLIDNAIKYNKKDGYVKITHKVKKDSIFINIIDNGIGIPKDQRERIFERFYTINNSRSRAKGGTGLGLSIVKHALSILKGEINIEENPEEKGSIFTIKLPMNVKRS